MWPHRSHRKPSAIGVSSLNSSPSTQYGHLGSSVAIGCNLSEDVLPFKLSPVSVLCPPPKTASGEQKTKLLLTFAVDRILTRDEALEFQRRLSLLSEQSVRDQYISAHSKVLSRPTPPEVQHFLCLWKVLWRWEQNSQRPTR